VHNIKLSNLLILSAKNVFYKVAYSDPHQALSFDRLHFNHGGLFSDHIWAQMKRHIESLGRHSVKQVDDQ
jgi:hypothetical protein